jgi:predicted permease
MSAPLLHAARAIRRTPLLAGACVVACGLTVGITGAVAGIYDALLAPSDQYESDRLVAVTRGDWRDPTMSRVSYSDFVEIKNNTDAFEDATAYSAFRVAASGPRRASVVLVEAVSESYCSFFAVRPVAGRCLLKEESVSGSAVAVISASLARSLFGGIDDAIGQSLLLRRQPVRVVGVLPESFRGAFLPKLLPVDVWIPLANAQSMRGDGNVRLNDPTDVEFFALAKLRPANTIAAAEAQLATTPTGSPMAPVTGASQRRFFLRQATANGLSPVVEARIEWISRGILLLTALCVGAACATVACLLLARAGWRRDLAVRSALGSSSARLAWCVISEALLVSIGGGVLGLATAEPATALLFRLLHPEAARGVRFSLGADPRWEVAGGTALATVTVAVLCSIPPVVAALRPDLSRHLRAETAKGSSRKGGRAAAALLAVQIAVALATVILAVPFLRDVAKIGRNITRAADAQAGVVGVEFALNGLGPAQAAEARQAIAAELDRTFGAAAVAMTSDLQIPSALGGSVFLRFHRGSGILRCAGVSPNYFDVAGISIRSGRTLAEPAQRASHEIVLSAAAAQQEFGDTDPVGRQVQFVQGGESVSATIVGVADDLARPTPRGQELNAPWVYVPIEESSADGLYYVSRPSADRSTATRMLSAVAAFDSRIAVTESGTLSQMIAAASFVDDTAAIVLAVLAAAAVLLSQLGTYALVALSITQRLPEFAVRLAVGAPLIDIWRRATGRVIAALGVGVVLGSLLGAVLIELLVSPHVSLQASSVAGSAMFVSLLCGIASQAAILPLRRVSIAKLLTT